MISNEPGLHCDQCYKRKKLNALNFERDICVPEKIPCKMHFGVFKKRNHWSSPKHDKIPNGFLLHLNKSDTHKPFVFKINQQFVILIIPGYL